MSLEDRVITHFLQSIGPWSQYIVIGGGYAPIIYSLYLSPDFDGNLPVSTRDIDSLLPRKVPKVSKKNIADHLKDSGFNHIFKDYGIPATECYAKKIEGIDIEIEFLTDNATRFEKDKNISIAGVTAQPLSYLSLSLQTSSEFETLSGEKGWVVSPGAWIFHKGLTFLRRSHKTKILKDLYGIWYVATQLKELSEKALDEFHSLGIERPKWIVALRRNLNTWIDEATPIDWHSLEAQDPYGKLKKQNFKLLAKQL